MSAKPQQTADQPRFCPDGVPLPFQAPKRKIPGGLGDSVPSSPQAFNQNGLSAFANYKP